MGKHAEPRYHKKPAKLWGAPTDARALDKYDPVVKEVPTIVVGRFEAAGHQALWVVSKRPDRRHGKVNFRGSISPYTKELLEGMFAKWKKQ